MGYDQVIAQFSDSIARAAVDAAGAAVLYLFSYISQPTEPVFNTLSPAYDRVLAMSLLVVGAVASLALIERILGGHRGAGPEVVIRTLAACAIAMIGLPLMRYAVGYADLLATVWNGDVVSGGSSLLNQVGPAYHADSGQAIGSALGLILAALLTVLLAILVHIELVLRAALLVVTTTLLPLAGVMAIWPRMAGTLTHMVGFLLALLLSKFVVATAVFLGFEMVVASVTANGDPSNALMTGLATLAAAAFAPLLLIQGIRFAEASAGHAARGAAGTVAGMSLRPMNGVMQRSAAGVRRQLAGRRQRASTGGDKGQASPRSASSMEVEE